MNNLDCTCNKRVLDKQGNICWLNFTMVYGLDGDSVIWCMGKGQKLVANASYDDIKYRCYSCDILRVCFTTEEFMQLKNIAIYSYTPGSDIRTYLKTLSRNIRF